MCLLAYLVLKFDDAFTLLVLYGQRVSEVLCALNELVHGIYHTIIRQALVRRDHIIAGQIELVFEVSVRGVERNCVRRCRVAVTHLKLCEVQRARFDYNIVDGVQRLSDKCVNYSHVLFG